MLSAMNGLVPSGIEAGTGTDANLLESFPRPSVSNGPTYTLALDGDAPKRHRVCGQLRSKAFHFSDREAGLSGNPFALLKQFSMFKPPP